MNYASLNPFYAVAKSDGRQIHPHTPPILWRTANFPDKIAPRPKRDFLTWRK
jgi:hypothetical protein